MTCDPCAALIGKGPQFEPHAGLHYLGGIMDGDGAQERYRCEVCGTSLQRIVPLRGSWTKELHRWDVLFE